MCVLSTKSSILFVDFGLWVQTSYLKVIWLYGLITTFFTLLIIILTKLADSVHVIIDLQNAILTVLLTTLHIIWTQVLGYMHVRLVWSHHASCLCAKSDCLGRLLFVVFASGFFSVGGNSITLNMFYIVQIILT